MATFIGRAHELSSLNERWGMRFQMALLWGRRRVGKTRLIEEFASDKPRIVFQADTGTAIEQLSRLTARMLAYREDPVLRAQPLTNWDAAIETILRAARDARQDGHPLLLVLDEFPRLVVSTPRLPSLLQSAIEDIKQEDLPLFLILAGSQVALYEEHVLHGPLFGRRTWGEQLPPLDYREAAEFFPSWDPADRIRAWSLLGGIPYYLEQWDPGRSLEWNITNRFLLKGSVLYDEAELMLKEELGSESANYMSIVAAVADGRTRPSEIGNLAGLPVQLVGKYLDQLRRLHIVRHLRPAGASERSRSGIWRIDDPYLRAWFRFIRADRTDLEAHRAATVFGRSVRPALDEFTARPAFEDAVREHVRVSIGQDPDFPIRAQVGAWWGQIPDDRYPGARRTREAEVEVVGYDGTMLVIAAEAKWSREPERGEALTQLRRTVQHVPGYDPTRTRLAIYTREGYTDAFRARAANEGVILQTAADLFA